jgi:transcriptional regulator with XRE-family HTH domain
VPVDPVALRRLRQSAGLTPRALAERAGLDRHTVSACEGGRAERWRPDTLARLAALGVAPEALAGVPPPG